MAAALFGFELGRDRGGRPVRPLNPTVRLLMLGFLAHCVATEFITAANVAHFTGLGLGFAAGLTEHQAKISPGPRVTGREARPTSRRGCVARSAMGNWIKDWQPEAQAEAVRLLQDHPASARASGCHPYPSP